jgi:WD40 repeat protein
MDFAFTPDGQTVIVARAISRKRYSPADGSAGDYADADLDVKGFDSKTGAIQFHHVLARGMATDHFWVTPRGTFVILHSLDDRWTVWDVAAGKRLGTLGPCEGALEAWDRGLIVKRPRGQIELVDPVTGETRLALKGSESWNIIASSPQASLLADFDSTHLIIWDLATNRVAGKRKVVRFECSASALSPDGTILAIGLRDGAIQLWDARTLELRATLLGHFNLVRGVAFSPDGRVLVSDSTDGTVRLWDVAAGEELLTRAWWQIGAALGQPRFAPDGRTLGFRADKEGESWLFLVTTALPDDPEKEENAQQRSKP